MWTAEFESSFISFINKEMEEKTNSINLPDGCVLQIQIQSDKIIRGHIIVCLFNKFLALCPIGRYCSQFVWCMRYTVQNLEETKLDRITFFFHLANLFLITFKFGYILCANTQSLCCLHWAENTNEILSLLLFLGNFKNLKDFF